MNYKLFVFKIILIFNFVIVYSISCTSLEKPGKYKIGQYIVKINKVKGIEVYEDSTIVVYYEAAYYLKFKDDSETIQKIKISYCLLTPNGRSSLHFATFESYQSISIGITRLPLTRLK